jgi:hypothetical protein
VGIVFARGEKDGWPATQIVKEDACVSIVNQIQIIADTAVECAHRDRHV